MLVQCTFVSQHLSLSLLMLHYLPTHPRHPLLVSFFAFVHFPPGLYPRRSMLSYPTDNSIILHAKTASDVLAQSASHLCEQITSYRKTDFIFEEERWSWFFFRLSMLLDPLPRSISRSLVLLPLFFLLVLLYTTYSRGQRLARLRLNDAILFLNARIAQYLFCQSFDSVAISKYREIQIIYVTPSFIIFI